MILGVMRLATIPAMSIESSDQALMLSIARERVARARTMSPGAKALKGPELFDFAAAFTRIGIRAQMRDATDEERQCEYVRRMAISEKRRGNFYGV